ncbi:aryl-alcohol oxidase [Mycena filopes]|nr:aryl-alcohol oxidase [Mycena filopes]
MFALLLVALGYLVPCLCKIYEDINQLPGLSYDFVVVGGGGAGNVVANRLTENPNFSVLVLEAGVSNENVTDSIVPFLVNGLLVPGIYEWNYTSIPQPGLNGRSIAVPRAHMLGGCTSHNGMVYTRGEFLSQATWHKMNNPYVGSADDYNRFAEVTGDPGWSWDRLLPYFFKNEKWTPPVDHHDTRGQFDPRVHSTSGINAVSLSGFSWTTFANHVLAATAQQPEDWHFNLDMNSGKPLGTGWLQTTIKSGVRSSSATSYLGPEFIRRPNLHVLLHAQVSKLVNPGQVDGKLHFGGVQFSQGGSLFTAKAVKEIVLSAGSVGTPNILMHSGIGDEASLTRLGIPTLLDLPSVGRNATDQPLVGATWSVNSTETADPITQNATLFNEVFAQWNRSHTGPFSVITTTHIAWLRVADEEFRLNNFTDESAGPNSPHIEVSFAVLSFQPDGVTAPATGHFMSVRTTVLNPVSRGSVTINSTNPFEAPVIDLGFLSHDADLFVARQAFKKIFKLAKAPGWENYIIAPTPDLESLSPDELDQYIRNTARTAFHFVGTAAMSARDAHYGVVDPDLLVKGASGLRIIDASIMPFVVSAHTQAATYVIAERGADLVKNAWK